jgi:Zn-finger nucleic acid-binding protein
MKCPVCDVPLSISSREGIEIDFCPQCRGVWLDRGELDKIIERAGTTMASPVVSGHERERYAAPPPPRDRWSGRQYQRHDRYQRHERGYGSSGYDEYGRPRKRKKRGFLEDLFEFGD